MYWGAGYPADTTTSEGYTSTRAASVSNLTSSTYNNLTMPTLTASDGGKTLYVRGSLDADGYFVCDGNVTLSMEAGYTYIPFGTLAPKYSGSTAQVPTSFSFNAISVPAYTIDSNGKLTHIDGKEIGGGGGVGYTALTDTSVSFTSNSDDFSSEYPYRATVTQPNVTASSYANAIYSGAQSSSGNYASFCRTDTGAIYLYARSNVGTQVIPTIIIGSSYIDYTRQPISAEIGTRTLTLVSSTDTEVSGYPYKYSFPCAGASVQSTADVTFGITDATSGNWAPICDTGADVIYIYGNTAASTVQAGYQLYYSDTAVTLTADTVGDDTHPVKIVNGQATAVTDGLEKEIAPTLTQINLSSYGFTYGSVYKCKVNDKIYTYSVYDANKSSTGKVYIDTSVKSSYNPRGVLMGTNSIRVSGLIGCDSSGVYINALVAGEWLIGQVTVVLT